MHKIMVGEIAPDFCLPATGGKNICLSDLKGQNVILYFYPKDCTSGCTLQGQDFKANFKKFSALNTVILGISRDELTSHEKFKEKETFPFELLSDTSEEVCNRYGVLKESEDNGKKNKILDRSTFLINKAGYLSRIWKNVKVENHVAEVLQAVAEI